MNDEFKCPMDCMWGLGEVWKGEYDLAGLEFNARPVVVDIGANCGAFAIWAYNRWKCSKVTCYEPNPFLSPYLESNLAAAKKSSGDCEFWSVNAAVGDPDCNDFHIGKNTHLCGSLFKSEHTQEKSFKANMVAVGDIPPCDILKIDAEGIEGYICENLTFAPLYMAIEWHGQAQRLRVESAMTGKMRLAQSYVSGEDNGMLKYIKPDSTPVPPPSTPAVPRKE